VVAVLPTTDGGSVLAISGTREVAGSGIDDVVELIQTGDLIDGAAVTSIEQLVPSPAGGREQINEECQVAVLLKLEGNRDAIVLATPDLRWGVAGGGMWVPGNFTLGLKPGPPHKLTLDRPGAANPQDRVSIEGPTAATKLWLLALGDVGSADLHLAPAGPVTVQEKLSLKYTSLLDIPAGAYISAGTVEANDQSKIFVRGKLDAGEVLINALFRLNAGSEVTTASMRSHGTVELEAGSELTVTGPAGLVNDGVLQGAGTIVGDVYSSFQVITGFSPGILSIVGDATLAAGNHLIMEIGGLLPGTEHDQLNVSGLLTLGGVLELSLINGFVPQPGDSLNLLAFGSLVGDFDDVVLPALGPGLAWDEAALANGGVISVVPEPTSSVLALGAMLGLMAVRRRDPTPARCGRISPAGTPGPATPERDRTS